jgi:hypothetical protein
MSAVMRTADTVRPLLDNVKWVALHDARDARGRLTAVEGGQHVPFEIARVFFVHQVNPGFERAGHAHKTNDQVAVAVHGSLEVEVDDGLSTRTLRLDDPARGLLLPRAVFVRLRDFSPGAVCLLMCSEHYDMNCSLRSRDDYLAWRGLGRP